MFKARAARELGLQTAANGRPAEIVVRLRSGQLAGHLVVLTAAT